MPIFLQGFDALHDILHSKIIQDNIDVSPIVLKNNFLQSIFVLFKVCDWFFTESKKQSRNNKIFFKKIGYSF